MKSDLNSNSQLTEAKRAGWISIAGNTLLAIAKFVIGLQSGSVAIMADAWHTASDSISSIIMLFGIKTISKPADQDHPFGHGRAQLIASLIIGTLLGMVAIEFLIQAVQHLYHHQATHYSTAATVVIVISIIAKEAMAQYAFAVARHSHIEAVKADAWHHRSDALSSGVILIGIFINPYFWWTDSVLGLLIAGIVFYAAIEIIKQSADPLLGQNVDNELVQHINTICRQVIDDDIETHHLHIHRYGAHTELTFHIRLNGEMSLDAAHRYTQLLEQAIRDELGIHATIHTEPK